MKKEIELLRKCQRVMEDLVFPGYPYQETIVVDLEEESAWVGIYGKKQHLSKALVQLDHSLIYNCLGAENTYKKSFLVDQHLENYKKYLDYGYEDFYVDNLLAWRFYFALNSAIFGEKNIGKKKFLFACIDCDTEWVEVQVFNSLEEIRQYVDEYFDIQ